ncbi:hypothetical protein SCA6_012039 [Theobroma cacao]
MKTAVSSLFNSKNLSHSAISRSLLQHSSKPFSQRAFFVPTIPRNTKNLYNQLYQKLQIRTKSTSVMASSFKPEQARAPPSLRLLSQKSVALYLNAVGGDKLYNSCCVFGTDGKLKPKHRKIHLFDIDISGKITFMEPKTLIAGETTTIVDTDVGHICIGICYDFHFQELTMIYAARGAHLLCYPGAFNMTTGPCIGSCCTEQVIHLINVSLAVPYARLQIISYMLQLAHLLKMLELVIWLGFGEVLATFEHDENIIIAEIAYSILEQRRDKDSIYACGGGHDVLLREEIHNYPQVVMVMVQISTYTQEDVVGAGMIYFVKRRWCEGGGGDLYFYMKGGGGDLYVYGGNGRRGGDLCLHL